MTAYQISPSGLQLISKRLPDEERQVVDDLCIVDGKLLQVVWEDSKFLLRTMTFSRESSITEAEARPETNPLSRLYWGSP